MQLDLRPAVADRPSCSSCGNPVTSAEALDLAAGGRSCLPCLDLAADESLLHRAAR